MILTYFDRYKLEVKLTECQKLVKAPSLRRLQEPNGTNRSEALVQHAESICSSEQYLESVGRSKTTPIFYLLWLKYMHQQIRV